MAMNGGRGGRADTDIHDDLANLAQDLGERAEGSRAWGDQAQGARTSGSGPRPNGVRTGGSQHQGQGSSRFPGQLPQGVRPTGVRTGGGRHSTVQQPDYSYENYMQPIPPHHTGGSRSNNQPNRHMPGMDMSAAELEEQHAIMDSFFGQGGHEEDMGGSLFDQFLSQSSYQPHPTQQAGYPPRNGGPRSYSPQQPIYEDEWYPDDGGRAGPLPMGDFFGDDGGFVPQMGGFGGGGFEDPDDMWEQATGQMDQMFGGMSLGGGGGGSHGGGGSPFEAFFR
jgi:hypothetical protein